MSELCGHWMPRAQEPCARPVGHCGGHLTAAAFARLPEIQRRFKKGDKARAIMARYNNSEKGKARNARANVSEARRKSRYAFNNSEAGRESKRRYAASAAGRAKKQQYLESEAYRDSVRLRIESGRQSAAAARCRRRKADERVSDQIDPRLDTLLGGILCQGNPTT